MLKACCDCIAAGVREERDVYGTQLNGNSFRAPLWTEDSRENGTMFVLPRKLNDYDEINITSVISSDPERFSISLTTGDIEPDYKNIGQLELNFPSKHSDDENTIVKTVIDGQLISNTIDSKPTTLYTGFPSSREFTVTIKCLDGTVDFYIGGSYVTAVSFNHNIGNVRYIIVDGSVTKVKTLQFNFA